MQILLRITGMAWRYRTRFILAYVSFFAAIGFSLLIPHLFGTAIDTIVGSVPERQTWVAGLADPIIWLFQQLLGAETQPQTLLMFALAILAVSVVRGFFDFSRTYTTDSLSQKVAYDLRNLI